MIDTLILISCTVFLTLMSVLFGAHLFWRIRTGKSPIPTRQNPEPFNVDGTPKDPSKRFNP